MNNIQKIRTYLNSLLPSNEDELKTLVDVAKRCKSEKSGYRWTEATVEDWLRGLGFWALPFENSEIEEVLESLEISEDIDWFWTTCAKIIFAASLPRPTIYDIKYRTQEKAPHYFTRSTMRFFGQTMKDFSVYTNHDGTYQISAPVYSQGKRVSTSERTYDPVTGELYI